MDHLCLSRSLFTLHTLRIFALIACYPLNPVTPSFIVFATHSKTLLSLADAKSRIIMPSVSPSPPLQSTPHSRGEVVPTPSCVPRPVGCWSIRGESNPM